MEITKKKRLILICAIVVLLVISVIVTAVNLMQANLKQREAERLEAEKKALEDRVGELKFRLKSPIDDEYVARVAREKLGLCYPDEIIYYNDLNK